MDHPSTRSFARYALGEITDDDELSVFEDHLMGCEACRRRAVAVDLMGSMPSEANNAVMMLHIAAAGGSMTVALCGDAGSRNIISESLLPGLEAGVLCPLCLAHLQGGTSQRGETVN